MKHKIGSQVLVKITSTKIILGKVVGYDGYVSAMDSNDLTIYYLVKVEGHQSLQQVNDEQLIRDSAEADQLIRKNLK